MQEYVIVGPHHLAYFVAECNTPSKDLLFVTFIVIVAVGLVILLIFIATTKDGVSAAPVTLSFIQSM